MMNDCELWFTIDSISILNSSNLVSFKRDHFDIFFIGSEMLLLQLMNILKSQGSQTKLELESKLQKCDVCSYAVAYFIIL